MSAVAVDVSASSAGRERLRPYRWGAKREATAAAVSSSNEEGLKKPRKSRFSKQSETPASDAPAQPGLPLPQRPQSVSSEVMQKTVIMQMKLKLINEKILTVATDAIARDKDPDRSPSPPPKYDAMGKRINTTEVWMRERLMEDRNSLIEEIMKANPLYVPPVDYVKPKPFRMLRIPQKEYPNYNFIGLIIGPRGNTQKRLEMETNTKISIRGKGSVKEGSKGRANKNVDESEELHVHITGDDEAKVIQAAKMIAELLVPIDDDKNEHKQKQLKELVRSLFALLKPANYYIQALINGTMKEDEFCPECGERGHRQFECPQRIKTFKNAGVKCSICGDMSHPTRDCPLKEKGPTNELALDSEYDSFLSELGGKAKESTVTTTTAAALAPKKQTVIHLGSVMTGQPAPFMPPVPGFGAPWGVPAGFGYPAAPYYPAGAPAAPTLGVPFTPTGPGVPPFVPPAFPGAVPAVPTPPAPTQPPSSAEAPPQPEQQYSALNEMD